MKINWRVFVAIALFAFTAWWAITSLRSQVYTGTFLAFSVGRGPVTVTNPSDAPVSVQLVGTGSRSFTVVSAYEGVAGSSTGEGSGRAATQVLTMVLPSGQTTFTVSNGTNVQFRADGDASLTALVQPIRASDIQTTMIASALVLFGTLFYLWRTIRHSGMSAARHEQTAEQLAGQTIVNADAATS